MLLRALLGYAFAVLLVSMLAPSRAHALSGGIATGGTTCTGFGCHTAASDLVSVSFLGPERLEPGETAVYTIMIEGDVLMGAGLNVALVGGGELGLAADDTTRILQGQIAHGRFGPVNVSGPPTGGVGVFAYDFTVTAPLEETTLTLNGAMNSFNGDFTNSGDRWNTTSTEIAVPEPAAGSAALGAGAALLGLSARRRRRGRA
jgi:hypothetical protein